MKMKIVILEDNADRRAEMQSVLRDRFYTFEAVFFAEAAPCIQFLNEHLSETILICLDHDLELIPKKNGQLHDPGTGREVADSLARQAAVCPVVIHSTNSQAVIGMKAVLDAAGCKTKCVTP